MSHDLKYIGMDVHKAAVVIMREIQREIAKPPTLELPSNAGVLTVPPDTEGQEFSAVQQPCSDERFSGHLG